ncbi:hypothetical protein KY285_020414 [Solanum tuberosum]|nr:hypothetical protein KY289_020653 [Solanum tuberosum]KAH0693317.1 hypothetical protein KY285_020414 [Solanum tuberosum]
MLAGRGQHCRLKKSLLETPCEISGFKNHQTIDYYKLARYPLDFKSKIKPTQACSYQSRMGSSTSGNSNHVGNFKPYANNTTSDKQGQDHTKLNNDKLD